MSLPPLLDLSHDSLALLLSTEAGLSAERWGSPAAERWIEPSSPLFAVIADGARFDAHGPGASVRDLTVEGESGSRRHATVTLAYAKRRLEVDFHLVVYPGTALLEQWVTVRNRGETSVRIERVDSFSLRLPAAARRLLHMSSAWGAEFESAECPLDEPIILESRSGRSSNGMLPFFALTEGDRILSGAVAWSGNWVVRLLPGGGGATVDGGLHDREFFADLHPGAELDAPPVALATARGDLNAISRQYHLAGRRHWYPRNDVAGRLPLEWNHWWSYEDRDLDEAAFRDNVDEAARLGLELCTLDAGWFGSSDAAADWYAERGDWERVNGARFPSGIRALSDYTHARGLLFGLWCEIEGLGKSAALARAHPNFAALRDGQPLGYVCFGCPEAQDWAIHTLQRLALDARCDWIKLDFNVDPGAGCNRADHGHGPGDGLYTHYAGYYRVLDRFRAEHPEVVLENCSSGGLRIDLGIAGRTHLSFLSDVDLPEHNLQAFWGASVLLAPEVCFHWSPSERLHPLPGGTFDPHDPALTRQRLDYAIRTALLGAAGFSLKLPGLPPWVADRIAFHARLYRARIRRFVRGGELHRLTGQPLPHGQGDRWSVFQYSLGREHLLFIFRMPGGEGSRTVTLRGLSPASTVHMRWLDSGHTEQRSGRDLMRSGLTLDGLGEEGSALVFLAEESR